jgi:hypothetical protein
MSKYVRHAIGCGLVLASLYCAGCIHKISSSVQPFSQAVALTATNVQGAFETVQRAYCDARTMNYAVSYTGTNGFDPGTLCQTWITPETLAARALVLQGLKQYASELSSLTASDISSVDTASTALGKSLTELTGTAPFKKVAAEAKVPDQIATTAVDALGIWLIQSKLQKELPAIIIKMDDPIQQISQLLIADIGTVGADSEHPSVGSGLRQVLWIQYGEEIRSWDLYVSKNYFGKDVSPDSRFAAIKQLVSLSVQRRAADQTLAQVAVTIKQMAHAHTELVKAAKAKQPLTADVSDLLAEAQRLNSYYNSLEKSK